ncbi:MAG: sulfite exporter TauE/SafE family protein [Clostridia bacterium]|nr:sulfite exporter TauE/SafE family protein [Clostridia bacterium]
MTFIDMLVTLLIATMSGMGIGSGGLMVLYLTFVRGAPQLVAQGFNLLFFLFSAGASMVIHLDRRSIRLPATALMIAAGLPAAYLGARLALRLPEGIVARLFGFFLILAGANGILSKQERKTKEKS